MAFPKARARNRAKAHRSFDSPASMGASKGSGPVAGAGELNMPFTGPGKAASGYAGMDRSMAPTRSTPSGAAPKGMKIYREE